MHIHTHTHKIHRGDKHTLSTFLMLHRDVDKNLCVWYMYYLPSLTTANQLADKLEELLSQRDNWGGAGGTLGGEEYVHACRSESAFVRKYAWDQHTHASESGIQPPLSPRLQASSPGEHFMSGHITIRIESTIRYKLESPAPPWKFHFNTCANITGWRWKREGPAAGWWYARWKKKQQKSTIHSSYRRQAVYVCVCELQEHVCMGKHTTHCCSRARTPSSTMIRPKTYTSPSAFRMGKQNTCTRIHHHNSK